MATADSKIARLPARRRAKKRACPICGKPAVAPFRPFCSERCRRIDLDRWLGEAYRIPADPDDSREKEPEQE